MKKLFALALVVLGLAACQTEPNELDVNVGGEVTTTVNISIPETTRATNSAEGAFANVDLSGDLTIRYILQVFTADGQASSHRDVKYSDDKSVAFDVRLIPGRDYKFVCWADIVSETAKADVHYDTSDLTNITLNLNGEWDAMDETRDAFTVSEPVNDYNGASVINIELKRPFAKLRVKTTDLVELGYFNVVPTTAKVTYSTSHRSTFNAFESKAESADVTSKVHEYTIATYDDNTAESMILFTDYFFAEEDIVKFELEVFDANGESIRVNNFTTDIPVKRNYVTTIAGNILTDGNNVNVTIVDAFENGNTTDPNYEYETISSDAEFLDAVNGNGGKYIVISDLHVAKAGDTVNTLATRATNGKTVIINLNGKTITVDNQSNSAVVTLGNNDALIFAGEGDIVAAANSNKLVDGGQVVVTGAAEVDTAAADVVAGVDALKYIVENGGEFTFTDNLESSEVVYVKTANPIVINGANFALTSSANRAIRFDEMTAANANVTINDLNIVVTTERVGTNDVRGVSIDPNLSNVTLTLNNCSVDFTSTSANDWTYAVNVSGNGTGHKVTINGGTYEGANVVNVHGAKNTIVVKNAILNSLYPNSDSYYGSCIWVLQKQESSVYAEGNTFNGDNAIAFNLGTGTVLVEKNNTDNTKYVAAKVGNTYYYNVAEAINAAEDGATVKVLQSHTCDVAATIANGKTLTLDLNDKTITGTDKSTGSFGLITNKGTLTVKNGTMTLTAENNRAWNAYSSVISNTVGGNLVVENATIEHLGGTDMAYGIDNLTNGKGTSAVATINDGAIVKSPYRAVRQFLNGVEAINELYVNAGATIEGANKSIWMQDPSKNANTGKLVVNEGAILNGDVYLFVTAGSTEWPVEVSIAASAVNGEVLTGNVPEGYEVVEQNGVWTVVAYTNVTTADELVGALAAGKNVIFGADITVAATKGGYNKAGILQNKAQVINGNGHTLTVTGAGATWDCAIYTNGGTIKNLTVAGAMRGIFTAGTSADLYIDNVTFSNVIYTFNSDGGNKAYGVYISNSNVNGWTSHSNVHKEVVYTNCSFGEGSGYKYCRPYGKTSFVNCTFCPGYTVDQSQTNDITFTNCTFQE